MADDQPEGTDEADVRNSASDMRGDIRKLKDDMAKLASTLSEAGDHTYGTARRMAADGMDQLRTQGGAAMDGFMSNARDIEEQMIAKVKEKPVTALAMAAGVGFLFALLAWR